jgi:hypothetical protein
MHNNGIPVSFQTLFSNERRYHMSAVRAVQEIHFWSSVALNFKKAQTKLSE